MTRLLTRAGIALCGAAVVGSALFSLPAQAEGRGTDAFTTKTPYEPQGNLSSYERLPSSFRPVFTENVSRHGARTLSDSDDGDAVLALWTAAKAEGALTGTGRRLGPDVQSLLAANARDGYGLLTQEGREEMRTTAQRLARRLPSLFADAAGAPAENPKIDVVASSQQRTVDSAGEFAAGLRAAVPGLEIPPTRTDDTLLYFHESDAAYQDYVDHDPRVAAAEQAATDRPRTHAVARSVLEHSFSAKFVDEIAAGEHAPFRDEVAVALFALDQVTGDLTGEGHWSFDRYVTPAEASWFGYLDDVTSFYEKGPGFTGTDITYRMAGGLLDDLFAQLDAKRAGTTTRDAELRFTHAEEIFPLATLLGLPGSTRQQPEPMLYTYTNNPFRGARVAPMAANVQWDLYSDGHTYLVRMLYNERQTAFKPSCAPIRRGSFFYRLDELERCYGRSR